MLKSTELILNPDGSIYHLHLHAHELADKIIFVGDPERVPKVAAHFERVELRRQHREFHSMTGIYRGQRMTVISTGIGTDNIDIVMNELDALANIDFETKSLKKEHKTLKIMRLGTCGGLQAENLPGTLVMSLYALGMDRLMDFYETTETALDKAAAAFFTANKLGKVCPYTASAAPTFSDGLQAFPHIRQGITVTAQGFYGPQGRGLGRVAIKYPELLDVVAGFEYSGCKVLNIEMETAAILGLGALLGHECASLSVILANRPLGLFSDRVGEEVEKLVEVGLGVMVGV